MASVITSNDLNLTSSLDVSLQDSIRNLISSTASATIFRFTSNSVGGYVSVNGTGSNFTFSEPYSNTSSFARTLTGGTIFSLTFETAVFGRYGGVYGGSTTISDITLPVASAFLPGYINTLLGGNDVIRLRIADTSDGPSQTIKSISVNAGSGDDVVIDEMASSTITPSVPGNPFNTISLGIGNDDFQIGNSNRSFWVTTGEGSDTLFLNTTANGSIISREVVVTDFNPLFDKFILTGQQATYARLQNNVGGVSVLAANGTVLAFLQNVITDQLTITNGKVQGVATALSGFGTELNDIIYGTSAIDTIDAKGGNDILYGGNGNDRLFGGGGNDILRGDDGADALDGGAGIDTADYSNSTTGIYVNLSNGLGQRGAAEGDTFIGIENVTGSFHKDLLIGSSLSNALFGGEGHDQVFGLGGNDLLEGESGNDALHGGDGDDVIGGGNGNDGVFGDYGNDTLYGGEGNDYLSGGEGNDVIWGDVGNDQIDAGAGNDFVVLGAGDDAFTLGFGDDRVRFDYGNGRDTINDFGYGHDVIDFSATDMTATVLQANAVDTAAGVLLQLGSGSILLAGLSLYQIEWNYDFAFAG